MEKKGKVGKGKAAAAPAAAAAAKRASSPSSDSSMSSKASGTIVSKPLPPASAPFSESKKTGDKKGAGTGGELKTSSGKAGEKKSGGTGSNANTAADSSKFKPIGENKTGSGGTTAKTSSGRASKSSKNGPTSANSTANNSKARKPTAVVAASKDADGKKSGLDSGETDSSTESSSDSDSEPKMTLSERFAKLTQMSTDKKEFAKPVLSLNEIDTKLKVVKDLRNADMKVYVDGQPPQLDHRTRIERIRPRTPDYNDGERRFSSDERRRHFERMTRDEPTERPADWSDTRVRYQYYKDRGFFRDRPCSFDEFMKWEKWWYKYRDWLANEGYYDQDAGAYGQHGGGHGPPPPQNDHWQGGGGHNHGHHGPPPHNQHHHPSPQASGRVGPMPPPQRHHRGVMQMQGPPHQGGPPQGVPGVVPLSSRSNFGRPDGSAYLQGAQGIRRRIRRTTNGSLIVNIRQSGVGPVLPGGGSNGFRTGGRIGPHHRR